MSKYDCFAISEQGDDPDTNDDFMAIDAELGIFAIADGIGGRPGGARASRVAVTTFMDNIGILNPESRLDETNLRRAIESANRKVRTVADSDPTLSGLGTTLSAVVIVDAKGKIAHVGDSRIYLFHLGKLRQFTNDHTVVAELVERNHLSVEGAKRHPLRNMLSRCIGTQEIVEPDIADVHLTTNDWLILATDGLTKVVDVERLEYIIASSDVESAEQLCQGIMKTAIAEFPNDNVTVIAVRIMEQGVNR